MPISMMRAFSRQLVVGALALVASTIAADAQTAQSAPVDPIAARSKGSPAAPITVYEMSDFQCPYCRRHALETFPVLEKEYVKTGKVRWVFINFPLTSIHDNAAAAAELSICAARQGKFWPVHDLLFQHQAIWSPLKEPGAFLLTLADSVGMMRDSLAACVQGSDAEKVVAADAAGAQRSGAGSTPTFYIEGGLLTGAQPLAVFRRVLDSIAAEKTGRPISKKKGPP